MASSFIVCVARYGLASIESTTGGPNARSFARSRSADSSEPEWRTEIIAIGLPPRSSAKFSAGSASPSAKPRKRSSGPVSASSR
jgi:hypothetical protein